MADKLQIEPEFSGPWADFFRKQWPLILGLVFIVVVLPLGLFLFGTVSYWNYREKETERKNEQARIKREADERKWAQMKLSADGPNREAERDQSR